MDNHDTPETVIDDDIVAKNERPSVLEKLKEAKAGISGQDKKKGLSHLAQTEKQNNKEKGF